MILSFGIAALAGGIGYGNLLVVIGALWAYLVLQLSCFVIAVLLMWLGCGFGGGVGLAVGFAAGQAITTAVLIIAARRRQCRSTGLDCRTQASQPKGQSVTHPVRLPTTTARVLREVPAAPAWLFLVAAAIVLPAITSWEQFTFTVAGLGMNLRVAAYFGVAVIAAVFALQVVLRMEQRPGWLKLMLAMISWLPLTSPQRNGSRRSFASCCISAPVRSAISSPARYGTAIRSTPYLASSPSPFSQQRRFRWLPGSRSSLEGLRL